jgi:hypothetical protein
MTGPIYLSFMNLNFPTNSQDLQILLSKGYVEHHCEMYTLFQGILFIQCMSPGHIGECWNLSLRVWLHLEATVRLGWATPVHGLSPNHKEKGCSFSTFWTHVLPLCCQRLLPCWLWWQVSWGDPRSSTIGRVGRPQANIYLFMSVIDFLFW